MRNMTVLVVAALVGAGCAEHTPEAEAAAPEGYVGETVLVTTDSVAGTVALDGAVASRRQTTISTRMMARVTAVNVDVGSRVGAGQVLMTLGTDDVGANRDMAEAAVMAATAARDEAARHAARMDTLYGQDVVSMAQRDQARLNLTIAESELARATAAVRQVATAEEYATIRAPFAGSVVSRSINVGDLAAPGIRLLELTADGPRDAVFGISPELAEYVQPGALVTIDAGNLGAVDATVHAVSTGANERSRTLEVRAEVPASWPTGVAVTAVVPTEIRAVLTIPEDAVVRRGQLTGVRVMTDDGEMLRWIRLGRQVRVPGPDGVTQSRVEVLSGLRAGERIAR